MATPSVELHTRHASPPQFPAEISESTAENNTVTRRYQGLLLLSGFMMKFQVIGTNSVFGIFQEFYTSEDGNISSARENDALVGTIGSGLTWSGGIFVNRSLARVKSVKLIALAGASMVSLGLLLASFSSNLWQLFATQALLYGIGSSLFAMGCILSGSGIGGLVMAPVLQVLLDRYGVRRALRILALWNFVVRIPVAYVIRRRSGFGTTARTRLNMALVRRGTFLYQATGAFLQAAGNVIPVYYMSTSVLSYSLSTGGLLLAINSGVNSVSRIGMGVLAAGVGRHNTMICSNALLPTTITEIYGVENYARVNEWIYFIRVLGSLLGAPIAGLILGSYKREGRARGYAGNAARALRPRRSVFWLLLLCAGMCVACVRWLDARDKGGWKA
ncbi:MFS general substrate transporter [Mycena olivaceomarginata]|nr:MFS general substrate transporter [Mycena olivaceomarginata]